MSRKFEKESLVPALAMLYIIRKKEFIKQGKMLG